MNTDSPALPWYKEPGVWMLLAPLILIFFVCAILVGAAVIGADDRITDDYYKEGKMINNRFAAENYAKALGLAAELSFDMAKGELVVNLSGKIPPAEKLIVHFSHPAQAELDHQVELNAKSIQRFEGELSATLTGRWYIKVEPVFNSEKEKRWRLSGENNFSLSSTFHLE